MSTQQFTTPNPIRVEITIAAGKLDVETVDGHESTVTIDGSQKALDTMHVELVGDRLVIEQRRKSLIGFLDRLDDSLRVRARVPLGSGVQITTASGEAALDGSFGAVRMKSASGGLAVTGSVDGDATVKTVSGGVRVPHVAGDLDVRTVSGHVAAESVHGSVSVKSVSANVRVGSLRQGQVDVQSVSGDVDLGHRVRNERRRRRGLCVGDTHLRSAAVRRTGRRARPDGRDSQQHGERRLSPLPRRLTGRGRESPKSIVATRWTHTQAR